MKNKKVLIFDFFGVICSEIAPFWLERYFTAEESVSVKADIVGKADVGEISEGEMFERLAAATGTTAKEALEGWLELAVIDENIIPVIEDLRTKYRVVLLSNAPAQFLHRLLTKHDLYKYFEHIVISSDVKTAKPGTEIYNIMLQRLGETPDNCVMIDDNPKNIEGAKNAGIDGWIYTDLKTFKEQF